MENFAIIEANPDTGGNGQLIGGRISLESAIRFAEKSFDDNPTKLYWVGRYSIGNAPSLDIDGGSHIYSVGPVRA